MNAADTRRVCYFGASPDTGNLGVSALCYSVLAGLARCGVPVETTVFDYGRGQRPASVRFGGESFDFVRCAAANTRRYYRGDSLWNIRMCARLGGLANDAARRIRTADAILDISGGDSFTDMYGPRRFQTVTLPKLITLEQRRPLILLPQTYGPYKDPRVRQTASKIVKQATMAWARDQRSFATLKELAGAEFDPERHCCGVDVAFGLEPREPDTALPEPIGRWLSDERPCSTIGFNVSGLIYNDPESAGKFGFKADYRAVVVDFLRRVLQAGDTNVVLIPHVITPEGHYESDPAAGAAVARELGDVACGRLAVLPPDYDESETKWIISRLDWFCGTRMHATIAALSSGTPVAAIAYSLKTQGVFETCGQGAHVADPRTLPAESVVERLLASLANRRQTRDDLAAALPSVLRQAKAQMDAILGVCLARQARGGQVQSSNVGRSA